MMSGRYPRVVSVLLSGVLAAACTGSEPDAPTEPGTSVYTPPEEVLNSTVIWSAEPGIDLFDSFPTLTRAAMEALDRPPTPDLSKPATTTAVAPPPSPPGPPVWQAPEENLFRGWTVDLNPPGDSPNERCAPWMAIIDPDAPAERTPVRSDEPPETLPAYPGWSRYRH